MEENKLTVSRMSRWESVAAIGWLPLHILGMPLLLFLCFPNMSGANMNFWVYAIGVLTLSLLCVRFLIRDFCRFFEAPGRILGEAMTGIALMLVANIALTWALNPFLPDEANPNNQALLDLARQEWLRIGLATLVLAPILEELMFRGGVFGLLRRWSRPAAYAFCVLLFALYHTWQYALEDPRCWLYMIQYLPAGFLLCFIYDRNECIWASILMHMINNGLSLLIMLYAGG